MCIYFLSATCRSKANQVPRIEVQVRFLEFKYMKYAQTKELKTRNLMTAE
uniref:Uncharacterized protein n=1 Tax=Arundo donax TaxID=35708 RepID=A0A0A9DD48_ARUDO